MLSVDPNALPKDIDQLQKLVAELCERLKHETSEKDKYRSLLRELLDAERNRKSEQLSKDQLALFETLWKTNHPNEEKQEGAEPPAEEEQKPEKPETKKRSGRQPLARHLVRERVVHDLAASEKHCNCCGKDLHLVGEETSERYEFIPAVMKVIEDVRLKYACDCTMKRADKPAQPIEKSTAGASVLAQVIVSKFADHLPLHRQEKIFERHGVEISRKTMGGWMAQCGDRLEVLYSAAKKVLFQSKVIGTDDTGVKVLDPSLTFARTGRIWPYVGDVHHPVVVYDYTATRGRDGPAKFLEGYTGYLQADAYAVYDAFFKPARGLIEVGCMMHYPEFSVIQSHSLQPAVAVYLRLSGKTNTPDNLQGFKKGKQLPRRLPFSSVSPTEAGSVPEGIQHLPFHFEVRRNVSAGRADGSMTEVVADDSDVDPGLKEPDRAAMSKHVWGHPTKSRRRVALRRESDVFLQ